MTVKFLGFFVIHTHHINTGKRQDEDLLKSLKNPEYAKYRSLE